MPLSTKAKKLLIEHPELCKEIMCYYYAFSEKEYFKDNFLNYFEDFIQQTSEKKGFLQMSEDGVKLFVGDKVFAIFTHGEFGFPLWEVTEWKGIQVSNWDETVKVFSVKEAAETYILENKPCLSLRDIMNNFQFGADKHFLLTGLVKQKLKQTWELSSQKE